MDTIPNFYNQNLANYFASKSLYLDEPIQKKPNTRKLVEQPWQQTKGEMVEEVVNTLCNLHFVEAKCVAGLVFALVDDYKYAQILLPENQSKLKEEQLKRKDIDRWTNEIIEYSKKWSERRHKLATLNTIEDLEPMLPVTPPLCHIWTKEEIDSECNRIIQNPKRLDKFNSFMHFVISQCYPLFSFRNQPGFIIRHAFNIEPGGYVHDRAEEYVSSFNHPGFLRNWPDSARPDLLPARINTLFGHTQYITRVCISPDGLIGVSASEDKTLRVWNLENGKCLWILGGHTESVLCVNMTPDKRLAVSGGYDRTLRLWDLKNGNCIRILYGHEGSISSVSITADGKYAVSGSGDSGRMWQESEKALRVWDLVSGECLLVLHGHGRVITSVAITANGLNALSVGSDSTLRIWNIVNGECNRIIKEENLKLKRSIDLISEELGIVPFFNPSFWQESASNSVKVTLDEKLAITGSFDGRVKVWDLTNGILIKSLEGHCESVSGADITPDGKFALSSGYDRQLRIWDIESGTCLRTIASLSDIADVSITPDARRALTGNAMEVALWNIENGQSSRVSPTPYSGITSICITKDGNFAITGGNDWRVKVWDINKRQCIRILKGHSAEVWSVSATPDGRYIVTGGADSTVRVWNFDSGVCLRTFKCQAGPITISPDGKRIICGVLMTLQIWDIESCEFITSYYKREHKENMSVLSVSLSIDGERALCGSYPDIWFWDLENKECLKKLIGHKSEVNGVGITPDGKFAVSGSDDNTIRQWDLNSGECMRVIPAHSGSVKCISITSDGNYFLSGSYDKSVKLWDFKTGECLAVFVSSSPIKSISVCPVSPLVICGNEAGEVIFLELKGLKDDNKLSYVNSISENVGQGQNLHIIRNNVENYKQPESNNINSIHKIPGEEIKSNLISESRTVSEVLHYNLVCPECNSDNVIGFKKIKSNNIILFLLLLVGVSSCFLLLLSFWWLIVVIPLVGFIVLWIKAYRLLYVCNNCRHKFFGT